MATSSDYPRMFDWIPNGNNTKIFAVICNGCNQFIDISKSTWGYRQHCDSQSHIEAEKFYNKAQSIFIAFLTLSLKLE